MLPPRERSDTHSPEKAANLARTNCIEFLNNLRTQCREVQTRMAGKQILCRYGFEEIIAAIHIQQNVCVEERSNGVHKYRRV